MSLTYSDFFNATLEHLRWGEFEGPVLILDLDLPLPDLQKNILTTHLRRQLAAHLKFGNVDQAADVNVGTLIVCGFQNVERITSEFVGAIDFQSMLAKLPSFQEEFGLPIVQRAFQELVDSEVEGAAKEARKADLLMVELDIQDALCDWDVWKALQKHLPKHSQLHANFKNFNTSLFIPLWIIFVTKYCTFLQEKGTFILVEGEPCFENCEQGLHYRFLLHCASDPLLENVKQLVGGLVPV
jgi:hypothetical protein